MPAPRKYDDETRCRVVRMYDQRYAEGHISQNAACQEVGELLGISGDTLRSWIRQRRKKPVAGSMAVTGSEETLEQEPLKMSASPAEHRVVAWGYMSS